MEYTELNKTMLLEFLHENTENCNFIRSANKKIISIESRNFFSKLALFVFRNSLNYANLYLNFK